MTSVFVLRILLAISKSEWAHCHDKGKKAATVRSREFVNARVTAFGVRKTYAAREESLRRSFDWADFVVPQLAASFDEVPAVQTARLERIGTEM